MTKMKSQTMALPYTSNLINSYE